MLQGESAGEKDLLEFLIGEADREFSGWDFSHIAGTRRIASEPLPWGYASIVLSHMQGADSLLDIGTGGGELLSRLGPLPRFTRATETYGPNVDIARETLAPLGVTVYETSEDGLLPFPDSCFAMVISRHSSYSPFEVKRVLRPGGIFITQQVGSESNSTLREALDIDETPFSGWTLARAVTQLRDAGLRAVEQQEAFPFTRFYDIGAVVYYLKAVTWAAPGFSVKRHREHLWSMHRRILQRGCLDVQGHSFLIVACNDEEGKGLSSWSAHAQS